jgi:hypothetical protein
MYAMNLYELSVMAFQINKILFENDVYKNQILESIKNTLSISGGDVDIKQNPEGYKMSFIITCGNKDLSEVSNVVYMCLGTILSTNASILNTAMDIIKIDNNHRAEFAEDFMRNLNILANTMQLDESTYIVVV